MRISKLILLLIISFFSFQCVETLITVNVFPDGNYHMQFLSKGDKKDIYDLDFQYQTKIPGYMKFQKVKVKIMMIQFMLPVPKLFYREQLFFILLKKNQ